MELKCQKQTLKLPVISFSGVPPFSFEELHSHFSPVNVFLPAVIKATMLQPDKIPYVRKKKNTHMKSTQCILTEKQGRGVGERERCEKIYIF